MPLESATYVSDLVPANPAHSDGLNQTDAHIRLIKQVLQNTFAEIGQIISSTGIDAPDGGATDPGLGYKADATAGFYRSGTGEQTIVGRLVGQGAVPIGTVIDFAGPDANIPAGFLACDGDTLATASYPELFAAIGYTWGGSGGTFYLPNLINRYRRHRDNSLTAGSTGNLQNPCNLSHYHYVSGTTSAENAEHDHTFSGSTGTMSANNSHTHNFSNAHYGADASVSFVDPSYSTGGGIGGGGSFGPSNSASIAATNTDHTHAYSGTTSYESANHAHTFAVNSGVGSADGNETRPYSATVLAIIRAF